MASSTKPNLRNGLRQNLAQEFSDSGALGAFKKHFCRVMAGMNFSAGKISKLIASIFFRSLLGAVAHLRQEFSVVL